MKCLIRRRLPRRTRRLTAVRAWMLTTFFGLLALLVAGAATGATPQPACAAGVTTNAAGTEVLARLAATSSSSPRRSSARSSGGEGNDIIYANPDVEEVDGGPGDDLIYGEPPEIEIGAEEAVAPLPVVPTYEPEAATADAQPQGLRAEGKRGANRAFLGQMPRRS